ncbi:M48 family metallopeptidase [Algicella marina]|uniref:M48 family metallopeptidase n=1 Tax=Algicella marina TaxID=2683284 RepID=UPI00137B3123|nr:SprT family zinc-dependent metalloprotease [Algicella marina]
MSETLDLPFPPGRAKIRRNARSTRLTLRIRHDTGEISVTAPPRVRPQEIAAFIHGHSHWIGARMAKLPDLIVPEPGSVLTLLGETVTLAEGARLRRIGDRLELPGQGARFRGALAGFVRVSARTALSEASDRYSHQIGRQHGGITLRDTRSRWGSCSSTGKLMYSWRLALAPPKVLDYVAAHEVSHLAEMNHGPKFWKLVESLCPKYRVHRGWLRDHGAELHRVQFSE